MELKRKKANLGIFLICLIISSNLITIHTSSKMTLREYAQAIITLNGEKVEDLNEEESEMLHLYENFMIDSEPHCPNGTYFGKELTWTVVPALNTV